MTQSSKKHRRYSTKQLIIAGLVAISILGNIATIVTIFALNSRQADYWLANVTIQRMCARDMKANLAELNSDTNRAFYSVSNCAGWNYKDGTILGDDLKAMMDKVEATQAPAGTVKPSSYDKTFLDFLMGY